MAATGVARVTRVPRSRLVLGLLGMVALLAGLWAALLLLDLHLPAPHPDFREVHGPLMVLGFLGTLIALERAVALGIPAGYAAPASAGLGALALTLGLPLLVGQLLLLVGGSVLLALYAAAARKQTGLHLGVMAAGAFSWVAAVLLWLSGRDVALLVPLLAGFLVLTIAGERLELARVVRISGRARTAFSAATSVFGVGLVVSMVYVSAGVRIAGAGIVLLAGWLAVKDVARRTVRMPGLTRYMAACLLAGYVWLAVAGALWAGFGTVEDGRAFDAMLHALFLGFVVGMVFAHAPVIVPAVFRTPVPYRRYFYAHVVLLHVSLLVRLAWGDLAGNHVAWQVGGVLNEIALLTFLAVTVLAVVRARRARTTAATRRPDDRRLAAATP